MKPVAPFVLVIVLLSGCTASQPGLKETTPGGSGSTIIVEDEEGGTMTVSVSNETGAVVGQVLSDSGFGLPNARVTVIGADEGAPTNETGWFQVQDVPQGARLVRAEHPNYRAAEKEILVKSGSAVRVIITLVPRDPNDAGGRPHLHDYWAGRERVLVTDSSFEFHKPRTGLANAWGPTGSKVIQLFQAACVSASGTKNGQVSGFWFDDPAQIVFPGAAKIEVTVSWTASDFVGGSTVGVVYKAPNMTKYEWSNGIKMGEVYTIPLTPAMWDNAHQAFTLWEFGLCIAGRNEAGPAGILGRSYLGRFHVKMELVAGSPVVADPPHPRFWENGTRIQILNGTRTFACHTTLDICTVTGYQGRAMYGERIFVWKPYTLIPPGTSSVQVFLNWSYSLPTGKPLGLAYSDASKPPRMKDVETGYEVLKHVSATANGKEYRIAVEPGQSDSFYQLKTNWAFFWGNEGEESSASYLLTCGCELKISLEAAAFNERR